MCFFSYEAMTVEHKILRKISEIVATRCQILTLKCSALDPTGGAYSVPPDSLAGFKGPYF